MIFGVDYYPEHWPRERWREDASLMRRMGLEVVRLAEFAWTLLEPREGEYSFDWLDEAISLFKEEGLSVILCTPTAIPPQWLVKAYPEILPVNRKGLTLGPGSRRHYCVNSPMIRKFTERIVEAMGEHYQKEEVVMGWQLDNEFSCHNSARCYCSSCLTSFREYVKEKYGSLKALNEAWGTVFWNMVLSSWDEVFLPKESVTEQNPGLMLDYYRFSSHSTITYTALQLKILRRMNRDWSITHNLMGTRVNEVDLFALGEDLDFISWDNYNEEGRPPSLTSMDHDLMRSLKKKPFWVIEQQVGQINWGETNPIPRPGSLELWTKQAIARGSRGILFFRFRACLYGQEQYHSGLLNHDGSFSRGFKEAESFIPSLKALGGLLEESRVAAEVGILFSYEDLFALELQPYHSSFHYLEHMRLFYNTLWNRNIGVDFLLPQEDLAVYPVLIAPTLYLSSEEMAERLTSYVEKGGTLILTLRSGMKDMANRVLESPKPGPFRELTGIVVEEIDSLPEGRKNKVRMDWGGETSFYEASLWCEILKSETAQLLGLYQDDFYAGRGAVSVKKYGEGLVFYIGAIFEEDFYDDLLKSLLKTTSLCEPLFSPPRVEVVRNVDSSGTTTFYSLLNHNQREEEIELPGRWMNLESEEIITERLRLEPRAALLLKPL